MKLTPIQQSYLDRTKAADEVWRRAKLEARSKIAAMVEAEIHQHGIMRDVEIRAAVDAGVPKRQLALEALRTSSVNAVYDSLARTEGTLVDRKTPGHVPANRDPLASRYSLNEDGSLRITADDELRAEAKKHDPASRIDQHPTADFTLNARGQLDPTPATSAEHNPIAGKIHDLLDWVYRTPDLEAEAVAWYRENTQQQQHQQQAA